MSLKPGAQKKLGFVEIIMGADAEVIKAAYEARVKIDGLLAERAEAYRRIVELENQVEEVVGEAGVFVYPPPPSPIAGWPRLEPAARRPASGAPAAAPHAARPAAPKKNSADAKAVPGAGDTPAADKED